MAVSPTPVRAPAWIVPLYVAGLVLLYIGERVLVTHESWRWMVSGIGVGSVLAATAARFAPAWQSEGERRSIERLLGVLSLAGVAALGLYVLGTDWGIEHLGLTRPADKDTKDRVQTILTVCWIVVLLASVLPMLFAEAALYPQRNAERLESRRVRAAAAAGLALALAAAYGSLFVYVADHSDIKADFSYFKTSDPSDSTRKVLAGFHDKLQIVAFFPQVSPVRPEVERYLRALKAGNPNVDVSIEDRYLKPKLANDMKIVTDGVIVIAKGDSKRTVQIGTDLKAARPKLKTLDRDLQERLLKLLREKRNVYLTVGHGELNDEVRGAVAAPGRTATLIRRLLEKQNLSIKDLGLGQGLGSAVPKDADLVMILGPTLPFAPEEIGSLERYAARGGRMMIALDPDAYSALDVEEGAAEKPAQGTAEPADKGAKAEKSDKAKTEKADKAAKVDPPAPPPPSSTSGSLEALAKVVGLTFAPAVLADDQDYVQRRGNDSDRILLVTNRFSSHAAVSTLSRNSARTAILVAGAGSLDKDPSSTARVDFSVRSLSTAFGDVNRNYKFDDGTESRKTYNLVAAVVSPVEPAAAAASSAKPTDSAAAPASAQPVGSSAPAAGSASAKPAGSATADAKKEEKQPDEMRAFVIADADAVSDVILANFMPNQMLLVDAVRWLIGEESFVGEVNVEEDVRIEHTKQKDQVWFYATIFGAPALVLGVGLVYSRRARRPRGRKA